MAAYSDSTTSSSLISSSLSSSSEEEDVTSSGSKLAELTESRSELVSRIKDLKQNLQNWRSKMDTQVTTYHDELAELKKSLGVEVDQLKTGFEELKSTLQRQQEEVALSMKKLGLGETSLGSKEASILEVNPNASEHQSPELEETGKEENQKENKTEVEQ